MKKTFKVLLLLLAVMITGKSVDAQEARAQTAGEFTPSGKPLLTLFADINNRFSDGNNVTSFEINRAYFGYEYSFTRELSARIIYDATAQTFDGKLMMMGYLRNAFLQYNTPKVTVRGGIIGAEQLAVWEKQWNYRYITRPFFEYNGMIFSSDLGIALKYKPADIIAFDFSVTNGKGVKDLAVDSTLRYDAGITITPAKNFIFRTFFDIKNRNDVSQWGMSFSGAYTSDKLTLGGEYYSQKNHQNITGKDYSGYNFFTSVKLADRFALFGIYDHLFSETLEGAADPWNIGKDASTIHFGVDFKASKGVRIAPNFRYTMPASDAPGTGFIGLNIEAKL